MSTHDNKSSPQISISISAAGQYALTLLALLLGLGSGSLLVQSLIVSPNPIQKIIPVQERCDLYAPLKTLTGRQGDQDQCTES